LPAKRRWGKTGAEQAQAAGNLPNRHPSRRAQSPKKPGKTSLSGAKVRWGIGKLRRRENRRREGISTTGLGVCTEGRGEGTAQTTVSGKLGRAGVVVWQVQRFSRPSSLSGDHGQCVDDSPVGDPIDTRTPSPGIGNRPRTGCRTMAGRTRGAFSTEEKASGVGCSWWQQYKGGPRTSMNYSAQNWLRLGSLPLSS